MLTPHPRSGHGRYAAGAGGVPPQGHVAARGGTGGLLNSYDEPPNEKAGAQKDDEGKGVCRCGCDVFQHPSHQPVSAPRPKISRAGP